MNRPALLNIVCKTTALETRTPSRREMEKMALDPNERQQLAEIAKRLEALESHHVTALSAVATLTAERDAARADGRRLTSALNNAESDLNALRAEVQRLRALEPNWTLVEMTAQRDALLQQVLELGTALKQLRTVASTALTVRNLRLSVDGRLTAQERRVFDDLARDVDAWQFPTKPHKGL